MNNNNHNIGASSDNRAVSPVIGVILMVAITVILAAVLGTFILDMAQRQTQDAPSVTMSVVDVDHDEDTIEIRHEGGDLIRAAEFDILVIVGDQSVSFSDSDGASDAAGRMGPGDVLVIDTDPISAQIDGTDYYDAGTGGATIDEGDRIQFRLTHVDTGKTIVVLNTEVL